MNLRFWRKFSRKAKIIAGAVAIVLLVIGSAATAISLSREEMVPMPSLSDVEIPPDILLWLEDNRETEGYGGFYRDGTVFVAARMGMKPTGGYSVKLGEGEMDSEAVTIRIEFISPQPWDMVTQAITYPHAIVAVDAQGMQPERVHFVGAKGGIIATVPIQYPPEENDETN